MASISLHNVKEISIKQEVITDNKNNLGTYDVITIIVTNLHGVKEEITIFGDNSVSLPGVILKEEGAEDEYSY